MRILIALVCLVFITPVLASSSKTVPEDPFHSVQWETMYRMFLSEHPVVFDERVRVLAPQSAENSMAVPIHVDATALEGVEEILVFADLNPIPEILSYRPQNAAASIGFRFKVQQATPVRAAALASDGVWHVGHVWLDAAGGGCTLPSVASGSAEWESHLGEVSARLWKRPQGSRLRFSVVHPMDTGLADGIPQFNIETMNITDAEGRPLALLETHEPVSENPMISLDLNTQDDVMVDGRDNNGNTFAARISP
jgi:sulfur-oxidizing protein SoxY